MAVYVGYRNEEGDDFRVRCASSSFSLLKEKMREHPSTSWLVAKFSTTKWLEAAVCQAIEDPTQLEADEICEYHVLPSGRVQGYISPRRRRG